MGTSHERTRRLVLKSGTFMNTVNPRRIPCSEFGDTLSEIRDPISQSGTSCLKSGTLLKIGDPISEIGEPSETRTTDPHPFTPPRVQTKIEVNISQNKNRAAPRG